MKLETNRHSLSHIMALAVQNIYQNVKFGIGPAIERGFYYDFELPNSLKPEDLPKIEKEIKKIIKQNLKFEKKRLNLTQAKKTFKGQPYKLELIKELEKAGNKTVDVYQLGNFIDLCKGPHIKSTKEINSEAFKLTSVAGAYWKGDEKNQMLQRIYGVAFADKKELDQYLKQLVEAEKRDHRVLGQQLELFMFDQEVGAGLPLWLPKGAILRQEIMEFAFKAYLKKGYQPVFTPHIASEKLWRHSGHLDFYHDDMYDSFGIDQEQYRLKPMNCPLQITMYRSKPRSYRELPIRWTEMGTVYRYEKSGVLHGLTRVRGFTQDDAHIICRPDQLYQELKKCLEITLYILKTFGFKKFEMNLSVRDPKNKKKFIGQDKNWDLAEKELKKALKDSGFAKYQLDVGGAVFYGPKIDVKVADSIGRLWQLSTIQFDFNLPGRFNMEYIGQDGKKHTPYVIHRALLGSLERFIGVYIEHVAGAFPAWLAPIQVQVIPVSKKFNRYAESVVNQLTKQDIRTEANQDDETLGKKIRKGELQKIPYLLIVGEKEQKAKNISVRDRKKGDLGPIKTEKFIQQIKQEIEKRK